MCKFNRQKWMQLLAAALLLSVVAACGPKTTSTPTLGIGSTMVSSVDDAVMVYVPAGEFLMGSSDDDDMEIDEIPQHSVYLDDYWIYQTEVTNAMYAQCEAEGACRPPVIYATTPSDYYGNPDYADYPVMNVPSWSAQAYCDWAGARLPTEAEWEKAARGVDGRIYPWGNNAPNGDLANYCDVNCASGSRDRSVDDGYADTAPVGSFPQGASPYGALDMAGNVEEWVADWYAIDYYEYSPSENPIGPSSGDVPSFRGGSSLDPYWELRVANRLGLSDRTGFRCAYSTTTISAAASPPSMPTSTTFPSSPTNLATPAPTSAIAEPSPTLRPISDVSADCPSPSGQTPIISSTGPGDSVVDIFEPQILDYLNNVGSANGLNAALSDLKMLDGVWKARVQIETIDVTGNSKPDVVVELTFYEAGQYSEGALFVFMCRGGQFVGNAIASSWGQVLSNSDPDGIRAIQDMNLNGVPEIVRSYIAIAGTHAYFIRSFRVLEWDGGQFVDLIPEGQYGFYAQADTGDGEIRDTDGDGTLELVLTNGLGEAYPDLGPQRKRSDIWVWDGHVFTLARWEYTEPEFRIHAVWDGDDASLFGDYEAALAFYQQAVFDEELIGWSQGRLWPDREYGGNPTPTPDPEERPRINAYGRYRIMLLHAVQGFQSPAQVVLDTLQEKFPAGTVGHPYAELAAVFWMEYSGSGDVGLACDKSIAYAADHPRETLVFLGRSFYGSGQREYAPEDICPFR